MSSPVNIVERKRPHDASEQSRLETPFAPPKSRVFFFFRFRFSTWTTRFSPRTENIRKGHVLGTYLTPVRHYCCWLSMKLHQIGSWERVHVSKRAISPFPGGIIAPRRCILHTCISRIFYSEYILFVGWGAPIGGNPPPPFFLMYLVPQTMASLFQAARVAATAVD